MRVEIEIINFDYTRISVEYIFCFEITMNDVVFMLEKKKYIEIRYGNIKVYCGINEVVGIIIEVYWIIRRIYLWCL